MNARTPRLAAWSRSRRIARRTSFVERDRAHYSGLKRA
jgi:hypothetical protein